VNLEQAGAPEVGLLADDHELGDAILEVVDGRRRFDPRGWALAHTGRRVAHRRLEGELERLARTRGGVWTRGIVERTPSGYAHEGDRLSMDPEYERLAAYLLRA
jgi:hypothetical protein